VIAGIDFKLSTRVTKADIGKKELTTDKGDVIAYEKLIIATGCSVRLQPARPMPLTCARRQSRASLFPMIRWLP
jgi:NADPH-dependent 2,4-dienoyl-CoA reductase/sulfur reductase-like enzyme